MTIEEFCKLLRSNWKYAAMDIGENWWVFEKCPVKLESFWVRLPGKSKALNVSQLVDIEPVVDWEASLIEVSNNGR